MFLKIFAALFHFDEHDRFPDVIGERSAAAILGRFQNAKFRRAADVKRAVETEGLKQPVEKDLHLAFFVAGDVFLIPAYKRGKLFGVRHGEVLREGTV